MFHRVLQPKLYRTQDEIMGVFNVRRCKIFPIKYNKVQIRDILIFYTVKKSVIIVSQPV